MASLGARILADLPYLTDIRHDLHAHPELMYQEQRTSGVVQRELDQAGVKYVAGLARGTGVLGYLPATGDEGSAPTIALRADMDALPILEETGKSYASTIPGKMHACGHDGHTTVLIGAARALAKTETRPNNVLFVFQPAEEGGAGGRAMCEDGVLAGTVLGKPANMIYGLHCDPMTQLGEVATKVGPMMAAADTFEIEVYGRGGHAAMPHFTVDPIVIASHIVSGLQTIASRNVSPIDTIVVTVAEIHAGTAHNIIPEAAHLKGTLRTLNPAVREIAIAKIEMIATQIAAAFGGSAKFIFTPGYPVTSNHEDAVARWRKLVGAELGAKVQAEDIQPTMGAEDFSFYGHHVPACFFWLGVAPSSDSYPSVHNPRFDFTDAAIENGVRAMCALALGPV